MHSTQIIIVTTTLLPCTLYPKPHGDKNFLNGQTKRKKQRSKKRPQRSTQKDTAGCAGDSEVIRRIMMLPMLETGPDRRHQGFQ